MSKDNASFAWRYGLRRVLLGLVWEAGRIQVVLGVKVGIKGIEGIKKIKKVVAKITTRLTEDYGQTILKGKKETSFKQRVWWILVTSRVVVQATALVFRATSLTKK
jgi:hypothetical protein